MSQQTRADWTTAITKRALHASLAKKTNKYHAKKTTVDGQVFDSAKEARRWQELVLMQQAGQITDLRRQEEFDLIAAGFSVRAGADYVPVGHYVADFTYLRDGRKVVEDVKSPATRKLPIFRLKAKILAANYGIEILEV